MPTNKNQQPKNDEQLEEMSDTVSNRRGSSVEDEDVEELDERDLQSMSDDESAEDAERDADEDDDADRDIGGME